MSEYKTVEWYWQRKTNNLDNTLFQYRFVHHKSHMDYSERELVHPRREAGD
jgi:hypothetical protein